MSDLIKAQDHFSSHKQTYRLIFYEKDEIMLADGDVDQEYWVRRFGGLDATYLQYISSKGFVIGHSFLIKHRFKDSLVCDFGGTEINITNESAERIYVTRQSAS